MEQADATFRIMTLNIGGGIKTNDQVKESIPRERDDALKSLITKINADILCVQEVAQYVDADGVLHSMMDLFKSGGGYPYALFGETLSMKQHMQVKKDAMVDGIFKDWWDWSKGNAIFSRTPFARLGDETREGSPRNIPIFRPILYEGSRDTDPRYVILGRLKQYPYPYLVNLHLTTLVGERGPNAWSDVIDAARLTRHQQLMRVLDLVQRNILDRGKPLILLGDFNANPEEFTIKDFLEQEMGFKRLLPRNNVPTHPVAGLVDHIFFHPAERLVHYECWIENQKLAHQVSDHLPVIADITIK